MPQRIRLSYRISLIVATPLLVVGLAGLIIWQSYAASSLSFAGGSPRKLCPPASAWRRARS